MEHIEENDYTVQVDSLANENSIVNETLEMDTCVVVRNDFPIGVQQADENYIKGSYTSTIIEDSIVNDILEIETSVAVQNNFPVVIEQTEENYDQGIYTSGISTEDNEDDISDTIEEKHAENIVLDNPEHNILSDKEDCDMVEPKVFTSSYTHKVNPIDSEIIHPLPLLETDLAHALPLSTTVILPPYDSRPFQTNKDYIGGALEEIIVQQTVLNDLEHDVLSRRDGCDLGEPSKSSIFNNSPMANAGDIGHIDPISVHETELFSTPYSIIIPSFDFTPINDPLIYYSLGPHVTPCLQDEFSFNGSIGSRSSEIVMHNTDDYICVWTGFISFKFSIISVVQNVTLQYDYLVIYRGSHTYGNYYDYS